MVWTPGDFPEDAHFRFCSGAVCTEREAPEDRRVARLSVRLAHDVGARSVPVRFTVTTADRSRTVWTRDTTVRLERYAPNGDSCSPVVWTAGLRADPHKGLVPEA